MAKVYDGTVVRNGVFTYSATEAKKARFLDTLAHYGPESYETALALREWALVHVSENHLLGVRYNVHRA